MKYNSELLDLSFSVFTRYQAIKESIDLLRYKKEKLKILEVGGRGNYLKKFSPNDDITILDLIDSNEKNYVKGDGRNLPFNDCSYDIVLSTDVLEHVTPIDREVFLNEQIRVAKKAVIFAGPIFSKPITEREKMANFYYQEMSGSHHPWLKEHINYGLPTKEFVESIFSKTGSEWTVWYNQTLSLWQELIMIDMAVACAGTNEIVDTFKSLSREYNTNIYPYDRGSSGYRAIYIVTTNGSKPPNPPLTNKLNDLLVTDLMSIFRHIINIYLQIHGQDRQALKVSEGQSRLVEELSSKIEVNNAEKMQLLNDLQLLKNRINNIESSRIYRAYSYFHRLFCKVIK